MTIKTMLFGFAALGVSGAALTGGAMGGGHDAERTVARPPAEVYAAIASMSQEGVLERGAEEGSPAMRFEVKKEPGKAVHYILAIDGKTVGTVDLAVASEKDGAASLLTADFELDQAALKKLNKDGPDELPNMPRGLLTLALSQQLGEMAAKIEAGAPLETFGPDDLGVWRSRGSGGGETQETASGPLGSTEPMVDPNEAARNYLNGGKPGD
jgi:hypothetical protein